MQINLTPEQVAVRDRFVNSGSQEVLLIKSIISYNIDELTDVMNIDNKGNMGLQAAARQEAARTLINIFGSIFPDITSSLNDSEVKKTKNQWR